MPYWKDEEVSVDVFIGRWNNLETEQQEVLCQDNTTATSIAQCMFASGIFDKDKNPQGISLSHSVGLILSGRDKSSLKKQLTAAIERCTEGPLQQQLSKAAFALKQLKKCGLSSTEINSLETTLSEYQEIGYDLMKPPAKYPNSNTTSANAGAGAGAGADETKPNATDRLPEIANGSVQLICNIRQREQQKKQQHHSGANKCSTKLPTLK